MSLDSKAFRASKTRIQEVSDQPKQEGDCQISEGVDKQGQILIQERQGRTIWSVLFTIFLGHPTILSFPGAL